MDFPKLKLAQTLILHEGLSPYAYNDTRGFVTIGVGRCIDKRCENGLSLDEIHYLLSNDIDRCKRLLEGCPYYEVQSSVRKDVLVEMVFNLGLAGLEEFHEFLDAMLAKKYGAAVSDLRASLWAHQVGEDRVNNICFRILNDAYP